MLKTENIVVITIISILIISYLILYISNTVSLFLWADIFYATIMALIVGMMVKYAYNKYSNKAKLFKTTVTPPKHARKSLAKLILKDEYEFLIESYEKIFGREDFLGISAPDDLLYIGKEHFKIFKMDDGFYIEDLKTKNGTILNGKEIKGIGKQKLKNEDNLLIAKILEIKYIEEKIPGGRSIENLL